MNKETMTPKEQFANAQYNLCDRWTKEADLTYGEMCEVLDWMKHRLRTNQMIEEGLFGDEYKVS